MIYKLIKNWYILDKIKETAQHGRDQVHQNLESKSMIFNIKLNFLKISM